MIRIAVRENGNGTDGFSAGRNDVMHLKIHVLKEQRTVLFNYLYTGGRCLIIEVKVVAFGANGGISMVVRIYSRSRCEAISDQQENYNAQQQCSYCAADGNQTGRKAVDTTVFLHDDGFGFLRGKVILWNTKEINECLQGVFTGITQSVFPFCYSAATDKDGLGQLRLRKLVS